MGDSFGTTLLVVLGVLVALGLALAVAALVVIRRYDLPLRGTVATLASLAYVVSPVDAIPEIPFGPIGLIDDALVIIGAVLYVRGLIAARRDLDPAGLDHPGRIPRDLPHQPPPQLPRGRRGARR
ncbi:YkvA family protein [Frankia tisae]|nr:YkvA family protein [Frankia tisae]